MFLSNDFMYKMDKVLIRRVPGTQSNGTRMTDHRLLKLFIITSEDKRGPGYWKLNVSHLENEDYKKGIDNIVENLDENVTALEKWECFKRNVKDFSIYFARNTKKETGILIRQIENEISTLENDQNTECNMNRKRLLEAKLDTLCNEKAKGAQIRSRYKWVTEGEKNTVMRKRKYVFPMCGNGLLIQIYPTAATSVMKFSITGMDGRSNTH